MQIAVRIIYPLFIWTGLLTYGLEAVRSHSNMLVLFNVLILMALSEGFWISHLRGKSPKLLGDVLSFGVCLLAVATYVLYATWNFFKS